MTEVEHFPIAIMYLDRFGQWHDGYIDRSNQEFTWARGTDRIGQPLLVRWDGSRCEWHRVDEYSFISAVSKRLYPELKLLMEQRSHDHLDKTCPDLEPIERGQCWREDPASPDSLLLEVWMLA